MLNMFNDGIVSKVDAKTAKVKVIFPELDNIESHWLPVVMPFTYMDKSYSLPVVGSLVTCVMDEYCEEGRVLGAIYSEVDTPPVTDSNKFVKYFSDGTVLEYDKSLHTLLADVKGSAEIQAQGTVDIIAPTLNINSTNISIGGDINLTGSLTSSGDVIAAGISLTGHTHPGDSGGTTGGPS